MSIVGEISKKLTEIEGREKEVNIAQMSEIVSKFAYLCAAEAKYFILFTDLIKQTQQMLAKDALKSMVAKNKKKTKKKKNANK